ncbi:MAG: RNase H family protein [Verrucomicrobiota bacterium]
MLHLFIDGSVDPSSRMGVGAKLALKRIDTSKQNYVSSIKFKEFHDTSSTQLEIRTLLWALDELEVSSLKVYTDSLNIIGLPERRNRLEQSEYLSKNGKLLNNHHLYREFYIKSDQFNLELIKVKGHSPGPGHTNIESIFSQVDRASRRELRERI